MRQSQQNRRNRGRNNSSRKGQNPMTRSYESNGPDVKIRGTPSHIAEKYVAMARDALSSGDPVLAENYLQHAEHYNRIIMSYREQQGIQPDPAQSGSSSGGRSRNLGDPMDDDGDHDDVEPTRGEMGRSDAPPPGSEPQPSLIGNDTADDGASRRQSSSAREDRDRGGDKGSDRSGGRSRSSRSRRSRYSQSDDQPEFLKRPVRPPSSSGDDEGGDDKAAAVTSDEAAE